jgi:AraC-like DNA-binding protein
VLQRAARSTRPPWTRLALEQGFCDQSHLVREFQAFAGIAPGAYMPLSPQRASHVPVGAPGSGSRSSSSKRGRLGGT